MTKDLKDSLEKLAARSGGRAHIAYTPDLNDILYDQTTAWTVRAWIVFHRLGAYERLCLENAGFKAPVMWATSEGRRVRVLGLSKGQAKINPMGDPDGAVKLISLEHLTDFSESRTLPETPTEEGTS